MSMMYFQQVICSLFLIFGLYCAFEFGEIKSKCETCGIKESKKFRWDLRLCNEICLQQFLEKQVKKALKGDNRKLSKPRAPTVLTIGWKYTRLSFNRSNLTNNSRVDYILEVKPDWADYQQRNDFFTVFPYLPKYHYVKDTTYTVEGLKPNIGYEFRVIVVGLNESSIFSDWTNLTKTTNNCSKGACSVTNFHVRLKSRLPDDPKEEAKLDSELHWDPSTILLNHPSVDKYEIELYRLALLQTQCGKQFQELSDREGQKIDKVRNIFNNKTLATYTTNKKDKVNLYYDCWYKFVIRGVIIKGTVTVFERQWIFHIPACIGTYPTENSTNETFCGCPYYSYIQSHDRPNITVAKSNMSEVAHVSWNDALWRSNPKDVTYYYVQLSYSQKEYIDAHPNIHEYNTSFGNLVTGKLYEVEVEAFHWYNCKFAKQLESREFTAVSTCPPNNPCPVNSTCRPNIYFKTLKEEEYKCVCDEGFYRSSEGKCKELYKDPCEIKPCDTNQTCKIVSGNRSCECSEHFVMKNGTCVGNPCAEIWCGANETCEAGECECLENYKNTSGTCRKVGDIVQSKEDNTAIIIGVSSALGVIILVAVGIIIWLRYFHTKWMNFIRREFEDAVVSSGQIGPKRIELELSPEAADCKEMNPLYVLQGNIVIPDYLRTSVGLLELPSECLRFHDMIGKGAFGEVYRGEAHGLNDNSQWTTVAIKTLAESVKEEEIHDFLREIELMKDIGKHNNVIEMFGCCTRCRPHCLVLEYASGGNLLNYLKSLKQKCNEVAAAQACEMLRFEKEKFQKFFEPGKIPELSTSYSLSDDHDKRPESEEEIKQAEAFNLEVASKIKEGVRSAINTKELESFARQIACGMEHVAGLGIVHRDLAARNVLLGENKVLKISDFGLSREGTYIKQTCGKIPFRWLSIEAIIERLYSTASDVWAFGIVLWEICTLGNVPYPSLSDKDLKDFLLSGKRMAKEESCTEDIYEIMLKCWSHFPEDRPSFAELSKCLWDLEHEGNTYVNVDSLTVQPSVNHQQQGNENQEKAEQANNNIKEDTSDTVLGTTDLGMPLDTAFDNKSFNQSFEELEV